MGDRCIWEAIAPVKMKILRYENNPIVNKALRKAIMARSRLKNKFNKSSSAKKLEQLQKAKTFPPKIITSD